MSTELAVQGDTAAVPVANIAQLVIAAAQDPATDPAKAREFLSLLGDIQKQQAEAAFNVAMMEAQDEIKPVVRDAENSHTHSKYARLETIDARIRPIYAKHGFSLSFNSAEPRSKDAVRVLCDVRHIAGYAKTYELEGDIDVSGAKGTSNKTSIQGLGSSVSYLRRYLTLMIFNVTLTDEDNDGNGFGQISEERAQHLRLLVDQLDDTQKDRFYRFMGNIADVSEIQARDFPRALQALNSKVESLKRGSGK